MKPNKPINFGPKQLWIEIFAEGPIAHPTGDIEVEQEFRSGLLKNFRFLRKAYNYYPPFTAEHPEIVGELIGEPTVDGAVYGLISQLRTTEEGGVQAKVKLNELGKRLAETGALTYVSPSFYTDWRDPHTGNMLGPVLREVSAVTVPHQKNLKTDLATSYRLAEADQQLNQLGFTAPESVNMKRKATQKNFEESTEEPVVEETDLAEGEASEEPAETAMAEITPELEAMIAELVAQAVSAALAGEVAEVAPEDVSMSERVEALEGQLRTERNLNAVREQHPGLDKVTTQDLAAVRMHDEARYQRLSKSLVVNMSEAPKPKGNVGANPAKGASQDRIVSLAEEAAKAGVKRGKSLVKFYRSKGVDNEAINASLENEDTRNRISNAYEAHGNK